MKGFLFPFEGPNGVGKSSLSQKVVVRLIELGHRARRFKFPGEIFGTLGELVNRIHHDSPSVLTTNVCPAALQTLHVAAHIDIITREILPALRNGEIILLDRYWWSIWVYGFVNHVDQNTLEQLILSEICQWRGIQPETLFLIDGPERGVNSSEQNDFIKLRSRYLELVEREKGKYQITIVINNRNIGSTVTQISELIINRVMRKSDVQTSSEISSNKNNIAQCHITDKARSSLVVLKDRLTDINKLKPTAVYDALWRFATERQKIFFQRINGLSAPWTSDPVIANFKFTNVYRATDRTSQYLIRHVIYSGDQSPNEIFFRTILFKIFNKIETWEHLKRLIGEISYQEYDRKLYCNALMQLKSRGIRIYSAAYIMPMASDNTKTNLKHESHLSLLEKMIYDNVPQRLAEMRRMRDVFKLLCSYRGLGKFLAFQYAIDINYSTLIDFKESEFVVAGPGALDGIAKCFANSNCLTPEDIIKYIADRQDVEFQERNLNFQRLGNRPLQLIDCQNLLCEISKYSRVAYPEILGNNNRSKIKQIFKPRNKPLECWFPPKWGLEIITDRGENGNDLFK